MPPEPEPELPLWGIGAQPPAGKDLPFGDLSAAEYGHWVKVLAEDQEGQEPTQGAAANNGSASRSPAETIELARKGSGGSGREFRVHTRILQN
ncbi:hypothetical protein NKDENANG_02774 [Candidatus Entotheonellaceae bacterium PAL068K]